jgi:hypothetical protein
MFENTFYNVTCHSVRRVFDVFQYRQGDVHGMCNAHRRAEWGGGCNGCIGAYTREEDAGGD